MLNHPLSGWYRSPAGVTVVVVVRHFRLPHFIRDASAQDLADPCGLLRCCDEDAPRRGEPFSSEEVDMLTNYSLINIAHVHHVMVDMGLLDAYDYTCSSWTRTWRCATRRLCPRGAGCAQAAAPFCTQRPCTR